MHARIQTAGTPFLILLAVILTVLLLARSKATAADLYWDSNGNAAGFGNTTGIWGTNAFWNDNSSGGAPTVAFTATTTSSDTVTALSYTVWTSPNLNNWTEDTGAQQTPGAPDSNGVQTVETVLSSGLLANPALFIRMHASE